MFAHKPALHAIPSLHPCLLSTVCPLSCASTAMHFTSFASLSTFAFHGIPARAAGGHAWMTAGVDMHIQSQPQLPPGCRIMHQQLCWSMNQPTLLGLSAACLYIMCAGLALCLNACLNRKQAVTCTCGAGCKWAVPSRSCRHPPFEHHPSTPQDRGHGQQAPLRLEGAAAEGWPCEVGSGYSAAQGHPHH